MYCCSGCMIFCREPKNSNRRHRMTADIPSSSEYSSRNSSPSYGTTNVHKSMNTNSKRTNGNFSTRKKHIQSKRTTNLILPAPDIIKYTQSSAKMYDEYYIYKHFLKVIDNAFSIYSLLPLLNYLFTLPELKKMLSNRLEDVFEMKEETSIVKVQSKINMIDETSELPSPLAVSQITSPSPSPLPVTTLGGLLTTSINSQGQMSDSLYLGIKSNSLIDVSTIVKPGNNRLFDVSLHDNSSSVRSQNMSITPMSNILIPHEPNSALRSLYLNCSSLDEIFGDHILVNILKMLPSDHYRWLPWVSRNFRNIFKKYPSIYSRYNIYISLSDNTWLHPLTSSTVSISDIKLRISINHRSEIIQFSCTKNPSSDRILFVPNAMQRQNETQTKSNHMKTTNVIHTNISSPNVSNESNDYKTNISNHSSRENNLPMIGGRYNSVPAPMVPMMFSTVSSTSNNNRNGNHPHYSYRRNSNNNHSNNNHSNSRAIANLPAFMSSNTRGFSNPYFTGGLSQQPVRGTYLQSRLFINNNHHNNNINTMNAYQSGIFLDDDELLYINENENIEYCVRTIDEILNICPFVFYNAIKSWHFRQQKKRWSRPLMSSLSSFFTNPVSNPKSNNNLLTYEQLNVHTSLENNAIINRNRTGIASSGVPAFQSMESRSPSVASSAVLYLCFFDLFGFTKYCKLILIYI